METMEETMVNPDEYNGWTNRETWACALHLSNDEGLYREAVRIVGEAKTSGMAFQPAESLKSWVTEMVEEVLFPDAGEAPSQLIRSMVHDVGSFWRVDWEAVSQSFMEE